MEDTKSFKPIKSWQDLKFTDDYMFKKTMEAEDICIDTLNAFLSWDISRITYFEKEKALKAYYDTKGVQLDVYVRDEIERIYDVEMQVRKMQEKKEEQKTDAMTSLAKRARFYQSEIDTDLLLKGALYSDLRPTLIIFLCPFKIFYGKRAVYPFKRTCMEDTELPLPDETEFIFISLKGDRTGLSERACAILDYMDGKESNDPLIKRIAARISAIKRSETEERDYVTYEMRLREERAEGRKEGIKEGINKGEARATKLLKSLMDLGRMDDVSRVLTDKAYRDKLYIEYHL